MENPAKMISLKIKTTSISKRRREPAGLSIKLNDLWQGKTVLASTLIPTNWLNLQNLRDIVSVAIK